MNLTTMEEWEKRFDEEFDKQIFTPPTNEAYEIMIYIRNKDIKSFISQELLRQSEEMKSKIINYWHPDHKIMSKDEVISLFNDAKEKV